MDLTDKKMAIVASQSKHVQGPLYMSSVHDHTPKAEMTSSPIGTQVDSWSKVACPQSVVKYMPHENKLLLNNGKEYSYKALVLSPGLDHRSDLIEGLDHMQTLPEEENIFVH
jgi:NADH dehydrogenase FAD-containing subunit